MYLAFALDKNTLTNTTQATWQTKPDRLTQAFGRQALPMTWDYAEANPFSEAGGGFSLTLESLGKVLHNLPSDTVSSGRVEQVDATSILADREVCISTDPPYYDNINYADLSDYFYVWQRHSLREIYPDLYATLLVPKTQELIAVPHRFNGDRVKAGRFFESGLKQAFTSMRSATSFSYPMTVFYAFKQSEVEVVDENNALASTGWETMLEGLIQAGLAITGTWPVRTELVTSLKKNVSALASSVVIVCRPRSENVRITSRREFVNALRQELPTAMREMQSGNIAPVDLAQASIGPGMAVYSRYSKVLEPNGDRLTVRTALQLINQVLDEFLAETEGELDADSRFAVAWFEQHGFNSGQFGTADVLARAKNTSVEGLANAGVLESSAGKVRLLTWEEVDPGWDPASDTRLPVWEATHHLIERLNVHGEEGAAMLLAKMPPDLAAAARHLAYRLYSICERKGWAEHARDYNALVISWSSSQERAVEYKQQYQQGRLFG